MRIAHGLLAKTNLGDIILLETGVDTGVFTTTLNLAKILRNDDKTLLNGDSVQVIYYDNLNTVSTSVTFTIGVAAASIELDRSTYPVPKEGDVTFYIKKLSI